LIATTCGLGVLSCSAAGAGAYQRPADLPLDPKKPIKLTKVLPDQPDPNALSGDGLMTPFAATRHQITVRDSGGGLNGWARVRNKPGDLVQGNAKTNTVLDKQETSQSGYWHGGFLYGDHQGCGWVSDDSIGPMSGTPSTQCSGNTSHERSQLGYYWNGQSNCQGVPGTPSWSCDGQPVTLTCDYVYEWANVRPWGTIAPGALLRTIDNRSHSYVVNWRYITNDQNYIMVRDPHVDYRNGNWIFIPASCLWGTGWPGGRPIGQE
jgi:hypothetical protein